MAVPVVEGAKEKLAGAWAYLRSIPPHVWLGLVIGAVALLLAYLAWKNRNGGLSPLSDITPGGDPTSSLSPIADTGSYVAPNPQAGYYNYQLADTVTPDRPKVGSLPRFNAQVGYDIHAAAQENAAKAALRSFQRDAGAPAHGYDIHAQAPITKAASLKMYSGAPAHGYDIHAAAQAAKNRVVPVFKAPGKHQDAGIY